MYVIIQLLLHITATTTTTTSKTDNTLSDVIIFQLLHAKATTRTTRRTTTTRPQPSKIDVTYSIVSLQKKQLKPFFVCAACSKKYGHYWTGPPKGPCFYRVNVRLGNVGGVHCCVFQGQKTNKTFLPEKLGWCQCLLSQSQGWVHVS